MKLETGKMLLDRIVFDTNFFISLFINGKLASFTKLIIDNNITIFVCDELLTELKNVLLRPKFKKHFNKKEIKDNIEFIKLISTTINIDQRFDRAPDSKDNYLLDLCYTVKSYYLVTGDKPLLNLKHIGKIQLISPAIFYKLVKQQLADL
jgi:putative PIN family toxin of toxin-antitoxin system